MTTIFDAETLKSTLKDLNKANPSVAGVVERVIVNENDRHYSDLVPAAPKRKLPQLPKKGMTIKFVNLLLPFVENYWSTRKHYPETAVLMQHFGIAREEVLFINMQIMWLKCLDRRGIRRPDVNADFLSPKQQAAIVSITNFHDKKHKDVKLASLGISQEEYNGWMNDPTFKNEITRRADDILGNVGVDANIGLARLIQNDDFRAIKFYFEITGKAASPEAINVKQTMQILIEAVQKHVKDPTVLQAIAAEVNQVRAIQGVTP